MILTQCRYSPQISSRKSPMEPKYSCYVPRMMPALKRGDLAIHAGHFRLLGSLGHFAEFADNLVASEVHHLASDKKTLM